MGGVPCWKGIIDQRNRLVAQLDCMAESIRIAGSTGGTLPDDDDLTEFVEKSEALAKCAARIQQKVGAGQ